jgi:hypothetical protein
MACLTLMAATAFAEEKTAAEHPYLTDRFTFEAGVMLGNIYSTGALNDRQGANGTTVRFEDYLGLSAQRAIPDVLARWRITDRWQVEAEWFGIHRDVSGTAKEDIRWGDFTIPVGASAKAKYDIDILRLSAGYAFLKRSNAELGASAGLFASRFSAKVGGNVFIGPGMLEFKTNDMSIWGTVPVLGLYGAYAFSPGWLVNGRIEGMDIKLTDQRGKVLDALAALEYRMFRNMGITAGYRYTRVDVAENVSPRYEGELLYRMHGPLLLLRFNF